MDPKKLSTDELESQLKALAAEKARREKEALDAALKARRARHAQIETFLREHPKIIEVLAPEHTRTSCTDRTLANGFYSAEWGSGRGYRCIRCALLEVAQRNQSIPDEVEFECSFVERGL